MNKKCSKCKIVKVREEFRKNKSSKDGLEAWCKLCKRVLDKAYRAKPWVRTHQISYNKVYRANPKNKALIKARMKTYCINSKIIALKHYGNKCACCGEDKYEFLTFEHKNGGGAKHRRETGCGSGSSFIRWLIINNFPDFIELLCYNCNCSKGFLGYCPHQKPLQFPQVVRKRNFAS